MTVRNREIQTYPVRWYVLIVFSINAFLQSVQLVLYQSVPEMVFNCYAVAGISSEDLNTILSIGSIAMVISIPLMIFVDSYTDNIRLLTVLSSVFLTIQNVLRLLPHWFSPLLKHVKLLMIISQIFNNIGGAFSYPLPSRVASAWFPVKERVIATAVGSQLSPIGCAFSFFIFPLMVRKSSDLQNILYFMLIVQFLVTILITVYFPARPDLPPSYSELAKVKKAEQEARELLQAHSHHNQPVSVLNPPLTNSGYPENNNLQYNTIDSTMSTIQSARIPNSTPSSHHPHLPKFTPPGNSPLTVHPPPLTPNPQQIASSPSSSSSPNASVNPSFNSTIQTSSTFNPYLLSSFQPTPSETSPQRSISAPPPSNSPSDSPPSSLPPLPVPLPSPSRIPPLPSPTSTHSSFIQDDVPFVPSPSPSLASTAISISSTAPLIVANPPPYTPSLPIQSSSSSSSSSSPSSSPFSLSSLPFSLRLTLSLRPLRAMLRFVRSLPMVLIAFLSALQYGTMQTWAANISVFFLLAGFSSNFGSLVASLHLTSNAVGAVLVSTVQQRFPRREKTIAGVLIGINVLFSTFFIFCFPLGSSSSPPLLSLNQYLLSFLVILHGLFAGAPISPFFDAASEIGYPVSDGVTGGIVIISVSFGMFIIPLLFSSLGIPFAQVVTTVSLSLAFICTLPLSIPYKRSQAEEEAKMNGGLQEEETEGKEEEEQGRREIGREYTNGAEMDIFNEISAQPNVPHSQEEKECKQKEEGNIGRGRERRREIMVEGANEPTETNSYAVNQTITNLPSSSYLTISAARLPTPPPTPPLPSLEDDDGEDADSKDRHYHDDDKDAVSQNYHDGNPDERTVSPPSEHDVLDSNPQENSVFDQYPHTPPLPSPSTPPPSSPFISSPSLSPSSPLPTSPSQILTSIHSPLRTLILSDDIHTPSRPSSLSPPPTPPLPPLSPISSPSPH